MTEPLFVSRRQPAGKVKKAMQAQLSDNTDSWIEEVLSEAHKQHPYLGRFDTSVIMKEVNGERGYGIGFVQVKNKTAHLPTEAGQYLATLSGVKTARIPVVIKEQILSDIDVFMDEKGRCMPLNERRLNEALFRPDVFDSIGEAPQSDTSLSSYLTAPADGTYQPFNRGFVGDMKTASERSLLAAIQPGMSQTDITRVEQLLNADQELATVLISKHASLMQIIAQARPVTNEDIAQRVYSSVRPDVVYVTREGDSYCIKTGSHSFFSPRTIECDRIKLAELVGESVADAVDTAGEALITTDPVVAGPTAEKPKPIMVESFGQYVVLDTDGNEYLGWVFPITDFSGAALPLRVFTNGSMSAVQGDIAGVPAGVNTAIINTNKLEGDGFFYFFDEEGQVHALIPGTVRATFEDERGPALRFETVMADKVTLRLVEGLRRPQEMGPGEYALPNTVKFCPLKGQGARLADSIESYVIPREIAKSASVEILGDSLLWDFRGPGVANLPKTVRCHLNRAEAMTLAGCLGMTEKLAADSLNKSRNGFSVHIEGCRPVRLPAERIREAHSSIEKVAGSLPKKCLLLKEAASIDDTDTVDKVLALGFLTPENLYTFIEFLPDLESAVRKLAYMLLATRLGLPQLDEQAVRSAMLRLEEVIQALKTLVYQNKS